MIMEKKVFSMKLWVFMLALIIETCLFANNTSGWAALVVIMRAEGVFSHLCREIASRDELSNGTVLEPSNAIVPKRACSEQDERFNFVLTLTWLVAWLLFGPFVGLLVDNFNMKMVRTLGSLGYCLGIGLLALTTKDRPDLMLPGTILLHCGGVTVFVCSCRVVTVFGKWQPLVLSVLNGAMITSSMLFSVLKQNPTRTSSA